MRRNGIVCMVLLFGFVSNANAGSTDAPRILMVGDSWSSAMQIMRCFDTRLPGIGQRGTSTSEVGVLAEEFDSPEWMAAVQAELDAYPTIDIIHLSLGGNDFLNHSNWTPSMPEAEINAFIDVVNGHISNVIDAILAMRPNLRIAVCGYDFVNHPMGGATPAQANAVWTESERRKLAMVQTKQRTFFVHNLGLMHYYYGIPDAVPEIPRLTTQIPGGYAQNYSPMPGGNPNYFTPKKALLDQDIHLTMYGYDKLAERCINEFYGAWLALPVVYEILPLESGGNQNHFRVTFNKAVNGVDVTDFTGAGSADVAEVSGSGAVYYVTLSLNGEQAPGHLALVDNDSITDSGGAPLGGSGAGNGDFDYNGPLSLTDPDLVNPLDFDRVLNSIKDMFQPFAWTMTSLDLSPSGCDINGGAISLDPIGLAGNGLLDTAELGLITACLENEALDFSARGGVSHAMVQEAWGHNYASMVSDLGGDQGRLFTMSEGVVTLLAGLMTLGDEGSTLVPGLLLSVMSSFITIPPGTSTPITHYITLANYLGIDGDADGDGVSNHEEYDFFMPIGGKDLYMAAALNPHITPEPQCGNSSGGSFTEGGSLCLLAPDDSNLEGGFAWFLNGAPLSDDGRITGSHWRELYIGALDINDSGDYTCVYDNGGKTFGPAPVTVNALPAVGAAGLAGLALLLAGAATARLRRRK